MYKVEFNEIAIAAVDKYIYWYKRYFLELYRDTGIFSEQVILEKYQEEAKERHREIFTRIQSRLKEDIVLGSTLDNTLLLSWRSKTIYMMWEDEGEIRIVTELIIR